VRFQSVPDAIHLEFAPSAFTPEKRPTLHASIREMLPRGELKQPGTTDRGGNSLGSGRHGEITSKLPDESADGMQKHKRISFYPW